METDRLTTLDEFGDRRFVIPAEVKGRFKTLRNRVYAVLIIFFLLLPWIKINGVQALWLDIPGRRFAIFGQLFFAHDGPLIFLIVASAVLLLAATTAIWGRLSCGWACPQTVFIDGLYRRIEIWVEGNYLARRKLRAGGMTGERVFKSGTKWFLFFVVSSLISHSLIALFAGSDHLITMIQRPPGENWSYFVIVTFTTAVLLFNFGWFREQFCTIMCPYGRFQSVLMDSDSLAILYDEARGEPRKGKNPEATKRGDCVSCNRCVEVCPAKIDIRDGLQMECIACTACIDACNEIMRKVNKPENLIRYQSVNGQGVKWTNPRALVYSGLALLCLVILTVQVLRHAPMEITVLRAKDTPFQILPDDLILNHFKLHLFNQSGRTQEFTVQPEADSAANGVTVTTAQPAFTLKSAEDTEVHIFVKFPRERLDANGEARLKIQINEKTLGAEVKEVTVVGPRPKAN